jgi:hypothetical protein
MGGVGILRKAVWVIILSWVVISGKQVVVADTTPYLNLEYIPAGTTDWHLNEWENLHKIDDAVGREHNRDGTHKIIHPNDIITKNPWIDVRAFGAKGDGVTDDTAAIQAALDAASETPYQRTVYIPPGKYRITGSGLSYPSPKRCLHLVGGGGGARGGAGGELSGTVLYKTGTGLACLTLGNVTVTDRYSDNPRIENISFVGDRTNNTNYGIYAYGNYAEFNNIMCAGFETGMLFRGRGLFINCNFEENVLDGFSFGSWSNDSNEITFIRTIFNSNGRSGARMEIAANYTGFYKSEFWYNGESGLKVIANSVNGLGLDGCWFEGNNKTSSGYGCDLVSASALEADWVNHPVIINNRFTSNGAASTGLLRMESKHAVMLGNAFDSASEVSMPLSRNPYMTYEGIQLDDSTVASPEPRHIEAILRTVDGNAYTLWGKTLADNTAYFITARVVGIRSDGAVRAAYTRKALVYRMYGGPASIQGSVINVDTIESNPNWDCSIGAVSNDVLLRIQAVPNTTVNWRADIEIIKQ